jgi:glycosyltransferase involved in cell wall biosynthesis
LTVIIPVHNEARVIDDKLRNLDALRYPRDRLRVLIVSDGSTDSTGERIRAYRGDIDIRYFVQETRQGKAAALNVGLRNAESELIVFTDASILLDSEALVRIAEPFQDSRIGCVSGEDHIPGGEGEGLYGRYELWLRNLESRVASIAGASGSFYAIRKELCPPFVGGMAPDFLSVLITVEQGRRAITEPRAFGIMSSTKSSRGEFQRKARTLIRGMAALWYKRTLLNPFREPRFAFVLWSHKVIRWAVPFFLIAIALSNLALWDRPFYIFTGVGQILFYSLALLGFYDVAGLSRRSVGKIALFFCLANLAIAVAWARFLRGERLEVWQPTQR